MDRLPLVSSAIIQVAQDLDEPWPVEVISHAGKAYNVSMLPGDMVLYESHSILHGRPFPLVGRKYVSRHGAFHPHKFLNVYHSLVLGRILSKFSLMVDVMLIIASILIFRRQIYLFIIYLLIMTMKMKKTVRRLN